MRKKLDAARARLVELLLETDDILLQINPQIEADYAAKIGYLENDLFRAQIAARRARRRVSLAQASVNAGENVDEAAYEKTLDAEFAEWEANLEERLARHVAAIELRVSSVALAPGDAKELKGLHRKLVRRLHPDLRGALSPEEEKLFMLVQAAYEKGDLHALRSLEYATRSLEPGEEDADRSDAELLVDLELIEAQASIAQKRLNEIKQSNPYALKEKLAKPSWVCDRVAELKALIEEQEQARAAFDRQFEELKGGSCG